MRDLVKDPTGISFCKSFHTEEGALLVAYSGAVLGGAEHVINGTVMVQIASGDYSIITLVRRHDVAQMMEW